MEGLGVDEMKLLNQPTGTGDRDTLRNRIVDREGRKPGLRGKIRAFCCHCIHDPYSEGTWLKQVENCTSTHCPLFSVRPVSSPRKEVRNG